MPTDSHATRHWFSASLNAIALALGGLVALGGCAPRNLPRDPGLLTAEGIRADSASFEKRCARDLRRKRPPLVSYDTLAARALMARSIAERRYEVEDDRHFSLIDQRGATRLFASGTIHVTLPWWHANPATAQALAGRVNGDMGTVRMLEFPIGAWFDIRVEPGTEVASFLTLTYDCRASHVLLVLVVPAPEPDSTEILVPPSESPGMVWVRRGDSVAKAPAVPQVPDSTPEWQKRLMPWMSHAEQERPWRDDVRIYRYLHKQFRDDAQVLFPIDGESPTPFEAMWVRTIAYDSLADLYLGVLLNRPAFLESLVPLDNVVFRADSGRPPRAIARNGDYSKPGWPESLVPDFMAVLRDGIRAYRAGSLGNHTPSLERCVELLTPAVQTIPPRTRPDERFVAHFVLGRCLAETYETDRAIAQFRAAIAIDPADVDAQMALLAELSVKAHEPTDSRAAADVERWDRALAEQVAVIRGGFIDSPGIRRALEVMFDPQHAAGVNLSAAELDRRKRIGFATLRWKRR